LIKKITGHTMANSPIDLSLSILLGLGLSAIIKMCCDSRTCMMYRAYSYDKKLIRHQDKCYIPSKREEMCDVEKKQVIVNE
jgi:hypothetical protein